ncbi:hypothetical protein WJX81_006598 [Elliptochloris bilobata]|uniref:Homologous recombination OB-fold protein OB-fold domain-containing protein n=1 Tax=Elliptochloris bilobata TaxID=381761 RepID=A0AAW1SLX7_9CHLO
MGLSSFDESSPQLQHTVRSLAMEGAPARVPRLVVLVVSLALTGHGEAFVRLKDPTGAIGAGVTARVLETEPNLAPGGALLLKDIAVLRMGEASYLAITPANVTKVVAAAAVGGSGGGGDGGQLDISQLFEGMEEDDSLDGEQTILVRKGGSAEKGFRPDALSFLLMPTSFHVDADVLLPAAADRYQEELDFEPKGLPSLQLGVAAELTGAWTVTAPADPDAGAELLAVTQGLHVYGSKFLQARLKWRPRQPLTLLELRARRLRPPLALPARDEFWGCFSWVNIGAEAAKQAAHGWQHGTPALPDDVFLEKQAALRRALRSMQVEPLVLG